MKHMSIGVALILAASITQAAPVVYTDKALYLADLAALGYFALVESFEDDVVWADSRNSIPSPGSTPSVISKGILWTSNFTQNNIATGDVGGSAPDGSFAIYSLPHGLTTDSGLYCDSAEDPNIPIECFQNDGLQVKSATGELLYAFGGHVDSNTGIPKITFLLDGVDVNANTTDNIDNWQREGDIANNWSFIGVIDSDGFTTAEIRELRGKDFQQVLLFSDDFTLGVSTPPVSCNVDMNQASYTGSDLVSISTLSISSSSTNPTAVEWKVWLEFPSIDPLGLINFGANSNFVLPAGFLANLAPIDLSTASNLVPGTYEIGCRLLDPVTGALASEDIATFEIVP